MRKNGKILVRILFFGESTIHLWKYFSLNIRADSLFVLNIQAKYLLKVELESKRSCKTKFEIIVGDDSHDQR